MPSYRVVEKRLGRATVRMQNHGGGHYLFCLASSFSDNGCTTFNFINEDHIWMIRTPRQRKSHRYTHTPWFLFSKKITCFFSARQRVSFLQVKVLCTTAFFHIYNRRLTTFSS